MNNKKENVVLSLSGGLDSSTLLLRCLREYKNVTAISFDYNQKHKVELEKAQSLVQYLNSNPLRTFHADRAPGGFEEMYSTVKHHIIKLDGLGELLSSTLVEGNGEVPEGHYEDLSMMSSVVENRNKIFASIIQAVALSISKKTGKNCDIALGIHANDSTIYPDCRQEFRDADDKAFRLGNWGSEKVHYFTPYLEKTKADVLKEGYLMCLGLLLDFDEVYSRTLTSYKPIYIISKIDLREASVLNDGNVGIGGNVQEGKWYSDYKSGSSIERILAFVELGYPDPAPYADETGPVTWEVAKEHALKAEEDFINKH